MDSSSSYADHNHKSANRSASQSNESGKSIGSNEDAVKKVLAEVVADEALVSLLVNKNSSLRRRHISSDSSIDSEPDVDSDSDSPLAGLRSEDRFKRERTVRRGTSPSHLAEARDDTSIPDGDDEEQRRARAVRALPGRRNADMVLRAVALLYYRPKDLTGDGQSVFVSSLCDKFEISTLDMLVSPLRHPNVWDDWTLKEIALFEAGICSVGKDFHSIQKLVPRKSIREVVDFFYAWKQSSHYDVWKSCGKPTRNEPYLRYVSWKNVRHRIERQRIEEFPCELHDSANSLGQFENNRDGEPFFESNSKENDDSTVAGISDYVHQVVADPSGIAHSS